VCSCASTLDMGYSLPPPSPHTPSYPVATRHSCPSSRMCKHDHGVLARRLPQPLAEGVRHLRTCGEIDVAWP